MAIREVVKEDIIITMKNKTYTATACGFVFKKGVATANMDIRKGSVDRVKIDNVLALNAGTSWRKKGDPDPEVEAKKAADKEAKEAEKPAPVKVEEPAKIEVKPAPKTEAEKQDEHKAAATKKKAEAEKAEDK